MLERQPEVDYVVTRLSFFVEPGRPLPPGFRPELLEGDHVGNMPSTLLVRASVFNRIGGFSGDYRIANDIDWFARAADSDLRRAVVPEVMVRKRVHDANLSLSDGRELNRELLDVLRRSIARRRA
jgi:GT2 family glycosyltransferase